MTDHKTDHRIPPAFLADMTHFDGELVVGFRPITEVIPDSAERGHGSNVWYRTRVTGYQLVTESGLYEFDTAGVGTRATALWSTQAAH